MIQRYEIVEDEIDSRIHPVTSLPMEDTRHTALMCRSEDVAELEAQLPALGTFAWAIVQVMNGEKVSRACWGPEDYIYKDPEPPWDIFYMNTHTCESGSAMPQVNYNYINATDWKVVG